MNLRQEKVKPALVKNRLRALRVEADLALWEASAATQIDQGRLSILERGGRPRPQEMEALASFYELPVEVLWPGFGEERERDAS